MHAAVAAARSGGGLDFDQEWLRAGIDYALEHLFEPGGYACTQLPLAARGLTERQVSVVRMHAA